MNNLNDFNKCMFFYVLLMLEYARFHSNTVLFLAKENNPQFSILISLTNLET